MFPFQPLRSTPSFLPFLRRRLRPSRLTLKAPNHAFSLVRRSFFNPPGPPFFSKSIPYFCPPQVARPNVLPRRSFTEGFASSGSPSRNLPRSLRSPSLNFRICSVFPKKKQRNYSQIFKRTDSRYAECSGAICMKFADSMRNDWNKRARQNAFFYIASWRKDWNEQSFFESGESDYQTLVAPVLSQLSLAPEESSMAELG